MKKLICLILALTVTCALTACGGDTTAPTHSNTPVATSTPDNASTTEAPTDASATEPQEPIFTDAYTFTYGTTTIAMNDDTASFIAALGEPKSYTEEESCAFEGLSKTYYFGSFYLETYPDGNTDRVYCVWLVDDSVTTEEGIYIGSTQQQVENAYGAQWYNGKNAYIVKTGDCILTIILENNVVNSIQYTAVTQ